MEVVLSTMKIRKHVSQIHLCCSTQGLDMIKRVTKLYLGKSTSISHIIQKLNVPEDKATSHTTDNVPG